MIQELKSLALIVGILFVISPLAWWIVRYQERKEQEHDEAVRRARLIIHRQHQRRINNALRRERKKGNQ